MPAATATAEPPLDASGSRLASHAFLGRGADIAAGELMGCRLANDDRAGCAQALDHERGRRGPVALKDTRPTLGEVPGGSALCWLTVRASGRSLLRRAAWLARGCRRRVNDRRVSD